MGTGHYSYVLQGAGRSVCRAWVLDDIGTAGYCKLSGQLILDKCRYL